DVLRVVAASALEPAGAGHLLTAEHRARAALADDVEIGPERIPEVGKIVDRPLLELLIALGAHTALAGQPLLVVVHRTGADALGRGGPQNGSVRHRRCPSLLRGGGRTIISRTLLPAPLSAEHCSLRRAALSSEHPADL